MTDVLPPRPRYRDLPDGRALGLYGPDDQLGALNLLTPERTRAAAALVRRGEVYSLNGSIDYPVPFPAGGRRTRAEHVVIETPYGRDDCLNGFYPQAGSQWDSFLHVYDHEHQCFYNGTTSEVVGIDAWAERGISGRGVLLDVARWRRDDGREIDWTERDCVTTDDLERCAADHGVSIEEGTLLLLRFGWETGWTQSSAEERAKVIGYPFTSPGLEPSRATVEWLWDRGVAAVIADNMAVEALPNEDDYFMHVDLLPRLGVPLGEFWHLDDLAAACAAHGCYEFLVTAAPLNVPGGIGSTANALALL